MASSLLKTACIYKIGGIMPMSGKFAGPLVAALLLSIPFAYANAEKREQQTKLKAEATELAKSAKVQLSQEQIVVTFSNDNLFAATTSELSRSGKERLSQVAEVLVRHPEQRVLIKGHTDHIGNDFYNEQLSENRARAVAGFLNSKGLQAERLITIGVGEKQPVASRDNSEGKNSRLELIISSMTVYG